MLVWMQLNFCEEKLSKSYNYNMWGSHVVVVAFLGFSAQMPNNTEMSCMGYHHYGYGSLYAGVDGVYMW